jgi:hypothetical protein
MPRAGEYIPPIGGKRTLRSIKKQSVPHMMAISGNSSVCVECSSDREYGVGVEL